MGSWTRSGPRRTWLSEIGRSPASGALLLVLANGVVLVGAVFLDWSVFQILLTYWLESGVVGAFNVLRIRRSQEAHPGAKLTVTSRSCRPARGPGAHSSATSWSNYTLFWLVHGFFMFFLVGFSGDDTRFRLSPIGLLIAVAGFGVSQAGEYRTFVQRGEYELVTPQEQITAPYGRVLVLQAVILVGAFAVILLKQPGLLVALLVLFKASWTFTSTFGRIVARARTMSRRLPALRKLGEVPRCK